MATTTRRKKLEKTAPQPSTPSLNFYCCRCGTAFSKQRGNFPASHSPLYRGSGFLPFCNDCIDKMYEQYCVMLADDREAMRRMCMKLDLYWCDELYDLAVRSAGTSTRMKTYIGRSNLVRFIDKTFDDTLLEEAANKSNQTVEAFLFNDNLMPVREEDLLAEIDPEIIDFWGEGYTAAFYKDLQRRYKTWTEGMNNLQPNERSLYKQICLLEATITKDSAEGKPIDKNINTLNTVLGNMNLKPAQQKDAEKDAELEKMPLGVGIEKWEYHRPLPETPDELKDISGTIRNITTWFLGHACKMVGLNNSYCRMYEDAMDKLRVEHPEYEEEDDDTMLNDIFGKSGGED